MFSADTNDTIFRIKIKGACIKEMIDLVKDIGFNIFQG